MPSEPGSLPSPTERSSFPRALVGSPGFLLGKAAQLGAELAEEALRTLNLKARHYGALVALDESNALSQHAMSQLLRIDRTTMVAVVDHLERLGLVQRASDPTDRRAYQVQLTPGGTQALAESRQAMLAADRTLVEQLSAEERRQLIELLSKVIGVGPAAWSAQPRR